MNNEAKWTGISIEIRRSCSSDSFKTTPFERNQILSEISGSIVHRSAIVPCNRSTKLVAESGEHEKGQQNKTENEKKKKRKTEQKILLFHFLLGNSFLDFNFARFAPNKSEWTTKLD